MTSLQAVENRDGTLICTDKRACHLRSIKRLIRPPP